MNLIYFYKMKTIFFKTIYPNKSFYFLVLKSFYKNNLLNTFIFNYFLKHLVKYFYFKKI